MPTPSWFARYASMAQSAALAAGEFSIEYVGEEPCPPPGPEIPVEVYNERPFNPDSAWAAVVALSKGG